MIPSDTKKLQRKPKKNSDASKEPPQRAPQTRDAARDVPGKASGRRPEAPADSGSQKGGLGSVQETPPARGDES